MRVEVGEVSSPYESIFFTAKLSDVIFCGFEEYTNLRSWLHSESTRWRVETQRNKTFHSDRFFLPFKGGVRMGGWIQAGYVLKCVCNARWEAKSDELQQYSFALTPLICKRRLIDEKIIRLISSTFPTFFLPFNRVPVSFSCSNCCSYNSFVLTFYSCLHYLQTTKVYIYM